jgi:SAM-dependent methyltransferase
MSFYRNRVYPQIATALGNPKPIQNIRQRIIPLAQGTVLEVGIGPGVNFAYYDPTKVSKIYALEPNPGMVVQAENQRHRAKLDIEFLDLPGELCTIPGVADAIRGIGRVLRPGGQFLFFEHGLSPDIRVRRWQERTEPFFKWVFEGCHVTRDIPALIKEGGFRVERIETGYLARFPKSGSYYFWGVARLEPR